MCILISGQAYLRKLIPGQVCLWELIPVQVRLRKLIPVQGCLQKLVPRSDMPVVTYHLHEESSPRLDGIQACDVCS